MNWRCIQLLRRIQKICIGFSPLDYPSERWGNDYAINAFIIQMLSSVAGVAHDQPTRFREARVLVHDIITKEGNVEYLKAEARMGIKRGTAVNPKDDPEDFEDPYWNFVPPELRSGLHQYSEEGLVPFKSWDDDMVTHRSD